MKNSFLPEPLPEKEWKLPRYKSEVNQSTEFYYEFSRSCEELHKWIIGGRRRWGVPEEPPEDYKLDISNDEFYSQVRKFPGWRLFGFMGALEDFPYKPFSECEEVGMKFMFFGAHSSPLGITAYDKSFFTESPLFSWDSIESTSPVFFNNPFEHANSYGSSSLAFLGINWGASDTDLVKEFKVLLKNNRPQEFKKPIEQQRRGLGKDVLPFKKNAALKSLGVWRRLKHLDGDWNTYMELYYPKYCRIDCKEYGRYDEVLRQSRRDVEMADKILRWFAGEKIKF